MLAKSIKHCPFMVVTPLGFQTEQPKQLLTQREGGLNGARNVERIPSGTRTTTVTGRFSL